MLMTVWVVIHIGLLSTTKEMIKCLDSFRLTMFKRGYEGVEYIKTSIMCSTQYQDFSVSDVSIIVFMT